jgi:hypothetical protein
MIERARSKLFFGSFTFLALANFEFTKFSRRDALLKNLVTRAAADTGTYGRGLGGRYRQVVIQDCIAGLVPEGISNSQAHNTQVVCLSLCARYRVVNPCCNTLQYIAIHCGCVVFFIMSFYTPNDPFKRRCQH